MFQPLVCNQRADCHHLCVHDWRKCFNDFVGTVTLNVSLAFAEMAKTSLLLRIFLGLQVLLCGDHVGFVNLHRNGRRCGQWCLRWGQEVLLHL